MFFAATASPGSWTKKTGCHPLLLFMAVSMIPNVWHSSSYCMPHSWLTQFGAFSLNQPVLSASPTTEPTFEKSSTVRSPTSNPTPFANKEQLGKPQNGTQPIVQCVIGLRSLISHQLIIVGQKKCYWDLCRTISTITVLSPSLPTI